MKTENRRGPSMEPCGTEALMGEASDDWPERTTLMDLPSLYVLLVQCHFSPISHWSLWLIGLVSHWSMPVLFGTNRKPLSWIPSFYLP